MGGTTLWSGSQPIILRRLTTVCLAVTFPQLPKSSRREIDKEVGSSKQQMWYAHRLRKCWWATFRERGILKCHHKIDLASPTSEGEQ